MPLKRPSVRPPGRASAKKATAKTAPATSVKSVVKAGRDSATRNTEGSARRRGSLRSVDAKNSHTAARQSNRVVRGSIKQAIDVPGRLGYVVSVAGSKAKAARLLEVDPAQTTRWAAGTSEPAGNQAARLLDLEYVMAHARLLWATDELVNGWLETPNAHLEHARPIDYMRVNGTAEVVAALRAEIAGAYA